MFKVKSEFKKNVSSVALSLLLVTPLFAQQPPGTEGDLSQAVDPLFPKQDEPGCALVVIKDGRIVHKRGYGIANLDFNIPNSPATVFNVASVQLVIIPAAFVTTWS